MSRSPLLLTLAFVTFAALQAPTARAQDEDETPITDLEGYEGIGAPPVGGQPDTTFPAPPARRPFLQPYFELTGDWAVDGVDAQGGPFAGTIRFQRLDGHRFSYERRVAAKGKVLSSSREVGEARIIGGRLYLKARPQRTTLGLENTLDPTGLAPGEVATRKAVMRLDDDAQRFEGIYRAGRQGGVERMRKSGWNAADNRVQLLVDGREAFPAFKRALASATRSIELQTFIYKDDGTGKAIANLLCERARAGVQIRVLVDAIGDSMGGCKKQLKAAGVEVVSQHGALDGIKNTIADLGRGLWNGIKRLFGGAKAAPREKRGIFNHDHRKILVVDGRIAFCGGMNMADEYEHEWHDVHAQVEGSATGRLRHLFEDRWKAAGGKGEQPPALAYEAPPGDMPVDVVDALPGIRADIKTRYLRETERARSRILIENAYFLDDDVINAMNAAVRRRVRTVLVIPGDEKHDVPLVRDAFAHVQNSVVRSGIELYKYVGPMVHTKVASWDGRVATVGSSNLDNMALQRLAEANIFVNDRRFALDLEQRIFVVDLPRSKRCSETELSFWQQLKGSTLHMIRSFL